MKTTKARTFQEAGSTANANKTLDTQVNSTKHGITTRRNLVEVELSEGSVPVILSNPDITAANAAKSEMNSMVRRGGLWNDPRFGNSNHPDTVKYKKLEDTVANPPNKDKHYMQKPDGLLRQLTMAEFDYATALELTRTVQ